MRLVYIKTPLAFVLFLVQYSALGYLFLSGPFYPDHWYSWISYLAGLTLGIWALLVMGLANLNAAPDVIPGGHLVSGGPYSLIRHPMYAAIFLVFIPLVITKASTLRILMLIVLAINLIFKIRYEEQRLKKAFTVYAEYSSRTWRLLPFVF